MSIWIPQSMFNPPSRNLLYEWPASLSSSYQVLGNSAYFSFKASLNFSSPKRHDCIDCLAHKKKIPVSTLCFCFSYMFGTKIIAEMITAFFIKIGDLIYKLQVLYVYW
jgi:hypothetical protein